MREKAIPELFTGPAGTGKTTACIEIFRDAVLHSEDAGLDLDAYFILPSREHSERIHALLFKDVRLFGLANHHVVTIGDFIRMKSQGQGRRVLTQFERRWMMGEILRGRRWEWLEGCRDTPGLQSLLADWIRELKSAGLDAKKFALLGRELGEKDPYFKHKFGDLCELLTQYEARLRASGAGEPEVQMLETAEAFRKGEGVSAPDLVIFDGFFGFTHAQLQFVQALSLAAGHAVVTLAAEGGASRAGLFVYPAAVRRRLLGAGFRERVFERPGRRFRSEGLRRLERFFLSAEEPPAGAGADGSVRLMEAGSRTQETEMIAREILRNVRSGAANFSDHMVVFRSVLAYRAQAEQVFARYGIPYQIHERKRLSEHPVVAEVLEWIRAFEFVPAACDADSGIRCDLSFLARHMVRGLGSPDRRAEDEILSWSFACASEAEWGAVRRSLEAFSFSEAACRRRDRVLEEVGRYLSLASAAAMADFFRAMIRSAARRGVPVSGSAEEGGRVERILDDLLEEHAVASKEGRQPVLRAIERFRHDAELGLYSSSFRDKNRVQIYDPVLALPKEYRIVFIAGLSEGGFPKTHRENSLFRDSEREFFCSRGVPFDTAALRRQGEHYLFYMMAARASEQLVLTRPRLDASDRPMRPSVFLAETEKALGPALPVCSRGAAELLPLPEEVMTPREARNVFADLAIAAERLELAAAVGSFAGRNIRELAAVLSDQYRPDVLRDPSCLEVPVRRKQVLSPSAVKMLHNCRFQFFAKYGLGLQPLTKDTPALVEGSILHRVMEELLKDFTPQALKAAGGREAFLARAREILERVMPEFAFEPERRYMSAARRRRLERIASEAADREFGMLLKHPDCWPEEFEFGFGLKKDSRAGALNLRRGRRALDFCGRIDRLDVDRAKKRALVVDYKLSDGYSRSEFDKGLWPQAWIYTLAVRKLLGLEPIGAEFVALRTGRRAGLLRKDYYEEARGKGGPRKRSPGDFESDLEEALYQTFEAFGRYRAGDIAADSVSCRYCDYSLLCRYEQWREKT